jgi:AcrR family transcriptional regulator
VRRAGRRPGETRTRDAILAAARTQFARHGTAATVREIATAADVDPALVIHFFGSKDDLFLEAMEWPFDPEVAAREVIDGPRSRMGRRLADFFLSIWDYPDRREPLVGLLRAATTNEQAAGLLRELLGRRLLGRIAQELGDPDAALRVSLCSSQLVGLGIARYIVEMEPLASMDAEDVAAAIAPTLQRYLTGPPPIR